MAEPVAGQGADSRQSRGQRGLLGEPVGQLQHPLERFTLDPHARQRLAELCKLLDTEPNGIHMRFGTEEAEQADALGALCTRARRAMSA